MTAALPATAIVIPTLDEAAHIRDLVDRLLPDGASFVRELIVADGGSTDGTVEIVRDLAARDPRVRLVRNPLRLQSAGINAAIAAADPACRVILRVDAHAGYPEGFAERVVVALMETGADSVVVRLQTAGVTCFQKAVAAAVNSRAGTGGSVHRIGGASGFVDHGHHAAFRRDMLETLAGYDETFVANEDAELDMRILDAGGRIWFQGDAEIVYYPRRSPTALARQYWRYGLGRAQTFRKHRRPLRLRQLAPPIVTAALALSMPLAFLSGYAVLVPLLYVGILCCIGAAMAARSSSACVLATPLVLAILHLAWGSGFIAGLIREPPARPVPQTAT